MLEGVAALAFVLLHVGVAGTRLRAACVRVLGERGFAGAFSLASVLALVWLVLAWRGAGTRVLWVAPVWVHWMVVAVMLPACWLLVASVAAPNPTMAGGASLPHGVRGVQRVTRHPMLWAFTLWAAGHVAANLDVAAAVFFGALLVTALAGMPSIDAKLARRDPALWATLARETSIVPGAAIVAGRNRLALGEISWGVWLGGLVLWAAMLGGHRWVFGVAPLG